jgi:hypothetical protein
VPGLIAPALSEPRQRIPNRVNSLSDGFGSRLHEIDVFGIAQRLFEQELVDRRTTAKSDSSIQYRRVEKVAQRTGND